MFFAECPSFIRFGVVLFIPVLLLVTMVLLNVQGEMVAADTIVSFVLNKIRNPGWSGQSGDFRIVVIDPSVSVVAEAEALQARQDALDAGQQVWRLIDFEGLGICPAVQTLAFQCDVLLSCIVARCP